MTRIILLVVVVGALAGCFFRKRVFPALPEQWVAAGSSVDGDQLSIDTLTRRVVDDTVFIWTRTDYKKIESDMTYSLTNYAFSCMAREYISRDFTMYDKRDRPLQSARRPTVLSSPGADFRWRPARPGSVVEGLLVESCRPRRVR